MRHIFFVFLTIALCPSICAQVSMKPSAYNYTVYIDNILVVQDSQSYYNNISALLRQHYYGDSLNLKQRIFLKPLIERGGALSIADNRLTYKTVKAREGYLYVNKKLSEWLILNSEDLNFNSILYRINDCDMLSYKDVNRLISLKRCQIDNVCIFVDTSNNVVVNVFVD